MTSTVSFTPAGTVSAPTITVTPKTESLKAVSSVTAGTKAA